MPRVKIYTEDESKKRKAESKKRWAEKNKGYGKLHYEKNKEIYIERSKNRHKKIMALKKPKIYISNKERSKLWCEKNKEKLIQYKKENYEKIKNYMKEWRFKNDEQLKKYSIDYNKNNRPIIRESRKKQKQNNPLMKLSDNLRCRISYAFKHSSYYKSEKTIVLLGCSIIEAKKHIELKFKVGMSWDNYNFRVWHIDHIIPLSSAKSEEELKKLCHYTNLQPLWALENLIKGNKIL